MTVTFKGGVYNGTGVAQDLATIDLLDRNTTTPVRATTNPVSGIYSISHATQGRYDVRITKDSTVIWVKYDDYRQMQGIEVAELSIRNPAFTFKYDITPGAILADRILNLPVITGTDTVAVLGLAQTFTVAKTFVDQRLLIRNPADTFSYTIQAGTIVADRNLILPATTGTDTLVSLALAQTFTAAKTFAASMLLLRNPGDTFSYTIVPAAIAADRSLTLPLIAGTDTLACLGIAQSFTAVQTFTASPVVTNAGTPAVDIVTSGAAGNAAIQIRQPAAGSGLLQLRFEQGNSSGDADNMFYRMYYDGTNGRLALDSADIDGASTGADLIRIPDGQTTIDANTTWDINVFTEYCLSCSWHGPEPVAACPQCGGPTEWHDDLALVDEMVHSMHRRAGAREVIERMEKWGLVNTYGSLDSEKPEIFISLNKMPWFILSALAQMRRRVLSLEEQLGIEYTPKEARTWR